MSLFRLLLVLLLGAGAAACQPAAPPVAKKWCDFQGTRPAQAPRPVTGAWSFLRCYGDGRLEKNAICLAFGERGGMAAKPSDNTLKAPLFHDWQDGRLVLRTCAPGDAACQGVTFTLEAVDAYTMYGTFTDGQVTGAARATLDAARDCELDPDEEFIPEVTPSPSMAPSVSPTIAPTASPPVSPSASASPSALPTPA